MGHSPQHSSGAKTALAVMLVLFIAFVMLGVLALGLGAYFFNARSAVAIRQAETARMQAEVARQEALVLQKTQATEMRVRMNSSQRPTISDVSVSPAEATTESAVPKAEGVAVNVQVDPDGSLRIDGKVVSRDELRTHLQSFQDPPRLILQADRNTQVQTLVDLIQIGRETEVAETVFRVRDEP